MGTCLADFLSDREQVSVQPGNNNRPPDLYLAFSSGLVGVEVTRLLPFTIEPDNSFGNATSQNSFAIDLIKKYDQLIGPRVAKEFSLLISMEVPVRTATKYRRLVAAWLEETAVAPVMGKRERRVIEGVPTTITVYPRLTTGTAIAGAVSNRNSPVDISFMALTILERQLRIKTHLCAPLQTRIWLALLNNYWLADADTYITAARQIRVDHCFERIFLVTEQGAVSELSILGESSRMSAADT